MKQLLKKINKLHKTGNHAEIIELIKAQEEQTSEIISLLARAYNNVYNYQKALDLLMSVEQILSNDKDWNWRLAYALFNTREFEKALPYFQKMLELKPNDKDAKIYINSIANKKTHIIITEETIKNSTEDNYFDVINPIWCSVYIYGTQQRYEADLKYFTKFQRYIFAIEWYLAEVNNGGHYQFFENSTGIVYKDALEGLKAIGHQGCIENFEKVLSVYGEEPSFDRKKRWEQLKKFQDDKEFEKLDSLADDFFAFKDKHTYILNFIKNNPKEFLFDGIVYQ